MKPTYPYLIGIDGGGTSCRCRLTDDKGNVLAETKTGSANVFQNPERAWESVSAAIQQALSIANLPASTIEHCSVVAGLAGAEVSDSAEKFLSLIDEFGQFELLNDAQIACLGAHKGQDGAVFIIGTGTIGIALKDNQWSRVGGWGFPLDDIGSGAWLGQQAIRAALYVQDGRAQRGALSDAVWQKFPGGSSDIISWSLTAKSGDYGTFAPLVLAAHAENDATAIDIVKAQIQSIEKQIIALNCDDLPLSLMGGLSEWVADKLPENIRSTFVPVQGDALNGALAFAAKRIQS